MHVELSMISLINSLFRDYGFNESIIQDSTLFSESSGDKEMFWIVRSETNLDTFIDNQPDLYKGYNTINQDAAFKKNVSLIILWETDGSIDNTQLKNKVMSVEENAYFFKKHVLYYSTKELIGLKEEMESYSLFSFIQKKINSKSDFKSYKNALNDDPQLQNWESLMYRIAIKLPFILLNVDISRGLDSLFEQNTQNIQQSNPDLFDLNAKLFDLLDKKSTAEIEDIREELMDKLIEFQEKEDLI